MAQIQMRPGSVDFVPRDGNNWLYFKNEMGSPRLLFSD